MRSLDSRVADLLDVTAEHDGWDGVTIADCLDMATGIGDAGPEPEPVDILADDGVDPSDASPSGRNYRTWIQARTKQEKLAAAFACGRYPWGPGRFARYRDQDIFVAGAAMDRLLERHTDGRATLWETIVTDVYRRIGASSLNADPHGRSRVGSPDPDLGLRALLEPRFPREDRPALAGGRAGGW